MLFRSLSILEGICKELDPNFSYFKVIDALMKDIFMDLDYLDHRARKDMTSLFDRSSREQIKSIQAVIEETNDKSTGKLMTILKHYQQLIILFVVVNMFDASNVPQSMALFGAMIFITMRIK
jgi:predicted unusual protein kinase regulating ubiquinone biosynthesis (AarF/ABC1/UbiB family)